nr:DUF4097 family beta strand repeat-containing protein [Clostridia bacterium]
KPSSNGELPAVTVESTEETIVIKETYPKQGKLPFIGNWTSGELEGILTVRVPRGRRLAELSVKSFSGPISMEAVNASTLYVSNSSGNIRAADCTVEYGASLETFSGALEVAGLRAESLNLSGSSGDIRIRQIETSNLCMVESFSGRLDIDEMKTGELELSASSGDIEMENVSAAALTLDTFSGAVSAMNLAAEGDVKITGSSGAIVLRGVTARSLQTEQFSGGLDFKDIHLTDSARMTSSSGNLKGAGLETGEVEMETFSGYISVSGASVDALKAKTSSGPCRIELTREAEATLTTFSGSVTLRLPKESSFDYSIDTFSGSVDFGFDTAREDLTTLGVKAGQVGEGGPSVRIDTSSGAITVRAK